MNVIVHETIMWRKLNNSICTAGLQGESNFQQKKTAAHLQFVKDHVDKPENYWKNVLLMDKTKIEVVLE